MKKEKTEIADTAKINARIKIWGDRKTYATVYKDKGSPRRT